MAMRPKKKTEELKMKIFNLGIKVAAAVGLTALISVSAMAAGITDTKHNLSSTQTSANASFDGTAEICVFCHTPHGAQSEAPLWNRVVGVASDYTAYSSTTLDGTVSLTGSPSLACLSCHDGSQAMNTIINAPSDAPSAGNAGYNYNASGQLYGTTSAAAGIMVNNIANLGTNLQNDHPVAIPYAGGGWSTADIGTTSDFINNAKDSDFVEPTTDVIGGLNAWWIEADGDDTKRTKGDLILYNRSTTDGALDTVGYVECATCHDPHNAGTNIKSFLRMDSNDNSQVCLACHIK